MVTDSKGVPTYTEGEPRETRFEELELYFPEELELYFPEVLELYFWLSLGAAVEKLGQKRDRRRSVTPTPRPPKRP